MIKIILSIIFCFNILIAGNDDLLDSTRKYLPKGQFSQIINFERFPSWCTNYRPRGEYIKVDSIRASQQIEKNGTKHIQILTVTYNNNYNNLKEYRIFYWASKNDTIWKQEREPILIKTQTVNNYYICK